MFEYSLTVFMRRSHEIKEVFLKYKITVHKHETGYWSSQGTLLSYGADKPLDSTEFNGLSNVW